MIQGRRRKAGRVSGAVAGAEYKEVVLLIVVALLRTRFENQAPFATLIITRLSNNKEITFCSQFATKMAMLSISTRGLHELNDLKKYEDGTSFVRIY